MVKSVRDYASAKTQATKSIPKTSQRGNHIIANESTLGIYNIQTTVGGLIQTTYLDYYLLFNTHARTNTYRRHCLSLETPFPESFAGKQRTPPTRTSVVTFVGYHSTLVESPMNGKSEAANEYWCASECGWEIHSLTFTGDTCAKLGIRRVMHENKYPVRWDPSGKHHR